MSNCFNENTHLLPVNIVLPANEMPAMATATGTLNPWANTAAILPKSLIELDRWVAHRNKVPVDCRTGINGDVTKPATWVSYLTAVGFTTLYPDTGLGFVISGDDDIIGIDIDHCLVEGNVTDSRIRQILDQLKSYAEVSQSGTGLHMYVRGRWPQDARNKVKLDNGIAIEVYDRNRYFTVTGNRYGEAADVVADQPLLDYIYEEYFKVLSAVSQVKTEPLKLNIVSLPEETMEKVETQIRRSETFSCLWFGTGRSGDESSDDMRLLCRLVPICNYSPNIIASAFLTSPYVSSKDEDHKRKLERPDYLPRSITRAIGYMAENQHLVDIVPDNALLSFEFNDFGNAQRLMSFYKDSILYNSEEGQWLLYEGGRWKPDNGKKEGVMQKAGRLYCYLREALNREYDDVVSKESDSGNLLDMAEEREEPYSVAAKEHRKEFERKLRNIEKLGNYSTQKSMVKAAEALSFGADVKFNQYDHLLVVRNGTVDLRDGNLLPHIPSQYITMRADIKYDPAAPSPERFLQFLDEVFDRNTDLIAYIHRLLGYCLTGSTREHAFFVLHGQGANGKSVLINLLKKMFPEYSHSVSSNALTRRNDEEKNPSLMQSKDARLVVINETNQGVRLNEALIKQISAGDEVSVRKLFKNNQNFVPHMKILWVTNHIPQIDWSDGGIKRRYKLIPFMVTFSEEKQDKELLDKLWSERERILRWLCEGAVEWYKKGLGELPASVAEALEAERRSEDTVYGFLQECVYCTGKPEDCLQAHQAYVAYCDWCDDNDIDAPVSETAFGRQARNLGLERRKMNPGRHFYIGVRLRCPAC